MPDQVAGFGSAATGFLEGKLGTDTGFKAWILSSAPDCMALAKSLKTYLISCLEKENLLPFWGTVARTDASREL